MSSAIGQLVPKFRELGLGYLDYAQRGAHALSLVKQITKKPSAAASSAQQAPLSGLKTQVWREGKIADQKSLFS